jgi:hypothetical protein
VGPSTREVTFVLRFQGCVAGRRLLTRRGPCPEPPEQGCVPLAPGAPEAGLAGWPMRAPDSWPEVLAEIPLPPPREQRHKRLSGCEPRVFTRNLGRGRLVSLHHITATPLWACDGLMTRARRENHPIRSPFDSSPFVPHSACCQSRPCALRRNLHPDFPDFLEHVRISRGGLKQIDASETGAVRTALTADGGRQWYC